LFLYNAGMLHTDG